MSGDNYSRRIKYGGWRDCKKCPDYDAEKDFCKHLGRPVEYATLYADSPFAKKKYPKGWEITPELIPDWCELPSLDSAWLLWCKYPDGSMQLRCVASFPTQAEKMKHYYEKNYPGEREWVIEKVCTNHPFGMLDVERMTRGRDSET